VIPTRKDQPRQLDFDKAAYRERNKVERLIGRLKQYRRIATRYEKRAANYLAMVTLGMTMLWLKLQLVENSLSVFLHAPLRVCHVYPDQCERFRPRNRGKP
jgi:hypothetical protein